MVDFSPVQIFGFTLAIAFAARTFGGAASRGIATPFLGGRRQTVRPVDIRHRAVIVGRADARRFVRGKIKISIGM